MRVWEGQSGKLLKQFGSAATSIACVTVLPGEKEVVTAGGDQRAVVWDLATGRAVRAFDCDGPVAWAGEAGDSGAPVAVTGLRIQRWELATGKALSGFSNLGGTPFGAAMSPDGKMMVTCVYQQGLCGWDAVGEKTSFQTAMTEAMPHVLAFAADGKVFAAAGEGQISLRDAEHGTALWRVPSTAGTVRATGISRDGKSVLSVDFQGPLLLLNTADGKPRLEIKLPGART